MAKQNEGLWMIFRRQSDGAYYLWNGKYPISITPDPVSWNELGDMDERDKDALDYVMETPKKRIFQLPTTGAIRYEVVAKGSFWSQL